MSKEVPKVSSTVEEFIAKINKTYKSNVAQTGENFYYRRFSSGVLSLDCALGGGWPFARACLIVGNESTGKTLLAYKAVNSVSQYDRKTRLHKSLVDKDLFTPCRSLLVDVENSFDINWAKTHGWNTKQNCVAVPDYAEQAGDIVDSALSENIFDLIIVDSIAMMAPEKELSGSMEDNQVGLGARSVNKAFRKWNATLSKLAQETRVGGACVICLNQFRFNISNALFGDPRTLPNGKAQGFVCQIVIYLNSSKVSDDAKADYGIGEYGGVIKKNKTYIPKHNFSYKVALQERENWPKGEVNNINELKERAKKLNLLVQNGSGWKFGSHTFTSIKQMQDKCRQDESFRRLVWKSVVKASGGEPV